MATNALCPCHSNQPYATCCEPFHLAKATAPTPEAMMRSRYAAFAKKLVPYLYETFHSTHEDRALPRAEVLRALRQASDGYRYMGLRIVQSRENEDSTVGWVLFVAKLFERGSDRSFVELSEFRREDGAWRYVDGRTAPLTMLKSKLDELTIDNFPVKSTRAS
ncbi:MAG: YchJ family metal-binding protein [Deltaproteobacteria bacterium]|nr:YchJ family metal-binding protein [Deltaproteobacteria bacterium]